MMKLSLALVMQRFRLTAIHGTRIDRLVRVTMSPRAGLPMILMPQDRQYESVPLRGNIADMVDWIDVTASSTASVAA
jgi:hypothetical protein